MNTRGTKVDALLFDKDGTLFDFHKTWSRWAANFIEELSGGDAALRDRLAKVMDYDLASSTFRESSPIIACTNREAAEYVAMGLGEEDVTKVEMHLTQSAAEAPQAPVLP
ncbi:MAG: HAD family hydrolase, partial [Pseudomonadota bacterium]